jgi:hypothetical protein
MLYNNSSNVFYNLKKIIFSFPYKNELQRYILRKYSKLSFSIKFTNLKSNKFFFNKEFFFSLKDSLFNFSYFEVQAPGKDFSDLENTTLVNLVNKLKEYGRESLEYWSTQPVGKSGTVFSIYGAFPSKSDFTHPRHVPHQAEWARFRIDWATRLCGFTIPRGYHGKTHKGSVMIHLDIFYNNFVLAQSRWP